MTQPIAMLSVFIYRNLSKPTLYSLFRVAGSSIPWRIVPETGDALISRSRSIAATKFLNSDSDVLVMTDDDFSFTCEGLEALVALCREKQCIVAGVTPLKSGEYTAIVPLGDPHAEELWRNPHCGPMKIKYAGGLIAYHRSVFETLSQNLPLLHKDSSIESFYPFFMPIVVGDEYLSEDYACHERAAQNGIEVWVEPKCQVGHLASDLMVTVQNMDQLKGLY